MKNYIILLLLTLVFVDGNAQSSWSTSSPEAQGMSSSVLANAIEKMRKDSINIHSLLIIRNDQMVLDASFYPFKNSFVHDLASVTKSVTALLIGIAIDKKLISSENEPVTRFFPEYTIKNDTLQAMTIKDLLNMSSGFECSSRNGENELGQMRTSDDWLKFMLTLRFADRPGKQFSYCSGNFYLLAEILQRVTKMSCRDFAERYLFKPLNIERSYWSKNEKGINYGWGDLHISVYDLAKIGTLILHNGTWKGRQVVSKKWIAKMIPSHKAKGSESYGYGWWFDSANPGQLQAIGRGGQRLFIFKEQHMVMATNGGGGYDSGELDDIAFQAIREYSTGENHFPLLQQTIKKAGLPDTSRMESRGFPEEQLDRVFMLDRNELGLKSIAFEKRNTTYYMILRFIDETKEEHSFGMNNQYQLSKEHTYGLPVAVKAWWKDDLLQLNYNRLTRIENYRLAIEFKANSTIGLTIKEASKGINQTLTGRAM